MAKRIQLGDIFEIETPQGKAYLQYVLKNDSIGELIRVLPGIYSEMPDDFESLASMKEKFLVFFPLKAAFTKKIIKRVALSVDTFDFEKPKHMRSIHNIGGEFLGWHIIDTETWQRQLVKVLTPEQKQLSPWGVWNDTLLVERITSEWTPEQWVCPPT